MGLILEIVFWLAACLVLYTYLGYPLVVTVLARWFPRPHTIAPITPTVSIIIPAYNEAGVIGQKLANTLALDYPAGQRQIIVVTDGSTDGTDRIAAAYSDRGVQVLHQSQRQGKPAAMTQGAAAASGDILVFTDANTFLTSDSLRHLVRHFADPFVAAVSGEKQVLPPVGSTETSTSPVESLTGVGSLASRGEGLYWRYESHLKRCDSTLSSVMGAAGELLAVRRAQFQPPPADALIEDFHLSLALVRDGWRVVYEPQAIAWETGSSDLRHEWVRRRRIAAGGFQAMSRLRPLLDPRRGRIAFQYISHRALRWAVAPGLLLLLAPLNLALLPTGSFIYQLLAGSQAIFYLAALAGLGVGTTHDLGKLNRLLHIPAYFLFTNLAALAGLARFLTGRQSVLWEKARR